jgi:hypothetical protein
MQHFSTREQMIAALIPKRGKYAEIGVLTGNFSSSLMSMLKPEKLVLIDLFQGKCQSGDQDGNNLQYFDLDESYKNLSRKYKNCDVVKLVKGDSATVLGSFDKNTFDMIYIDGDHSYEQCKRDLEAALKVCKRGGYICGHDYEMNMELAEKRYYFGVRRAVDEFILENGLELEAKGLDGCVSYAIQNVQVEESDFEKADKRYLVYYTHGYSDHYVGVLKLSLESLRKFNPNIDVLILCDGSAIEKFSDLRDVTFMAMNDAESPEQASMHKLNIFEYEKVADYDSVLFLDSDTFVEIDIAKLLRKCKSGDKLYVYTEKTNHVKHEHAHYSLKNYTKQQLQQLVDSDTYPFNAGCFAFRPTNQMRNHFQNVLQMIESYEGEFFYEQSFMNVYFNLANATNRALLTPRNYIMFPNRFTIYDDAIVHFCGKAGRGERKLIVMREYRWYQGHPNVLKLRKAGFLLAGELVQLTKRMLQLPRALASKTLRILHLR